jgi:hypothetical protein
MVNLFTPTAAGLAVVILIGVSPPANADTTADAVLELAHSVESQPLVEDVYADHGPFVNEDLDEIVYDNGLGGCGSGAEPVGDYTFVYPPGLGFVGDHPIVAWGGGWQPFEADPVCRYDDVLRHLASWGFVVVAPNNGCLGDGSAIGAAAERMVQLNSDESSPFFGNLDTTKIAAAGHSQGGAGALNATIDSNGLITSTLTGGAPGPDWPRDSWFCPNGEYPLPEFSQLTDPVFLIRGNDFVEDLVSPEVGNQAFYDQIPGPAAKATVVEGSHDNLTEAVGYATAWLLYTLADVDEARSAFVGNPPEIETNDRWINWSGKNLP